MYLETIVVSKYSYCPVVQGLNPPQIVNVSEPKFSGIRGYIYASL